MVYSKININSKSPAFLVQDNTGQLFAMGQTDLYKFFWWPTSSTHCKVVQGMKLHMAASPFLFYRNKTKNTYLLVEKN